MKLNTKWTGQVEIESVVDISEQNYVNLQKYTEIFKECFDDIVSEIIANVFKNEDRVKVKGLDFQYETVKEGQEEGNQ